MNMTMAELENQLNELAVMEQKTPEVFKKLDNEFWMIGALKDLYDMCKDYSQTEVPADLGVTSDVIPAVRVIKVNRYVDPDLLMRYKVDSTNFCGLFMATEGAFVSKKLMDSYFNERIDNCKKELNPVRDLGLSDEFRWETIRRIDGGDGFVLKWTSINEEIPSFNYWEFLNL